MSKRPADIGKHLASRRAVKRMLDRQKVVIVSKRFGQGHVTTRVLVGGEYYEVDNRQLDLLEMGRSPTQLGIEPVAHH